MKIYDYEGFANISGAAIKEQRRKMKISQEQLAAQLQVAGISIDQKAVSRIERQERFLADFELREIARILCMPVEELIK